MGERLRWNVKQNGDVSMFVVITFGLECFEFDTVFRVNFSGPIKHINVDCDGWEH